MKRRQLLIAGGGVVLLPRLAGAQQSRVDRTGAAWAQLSEESRREILRVDYEEYAQHAQPHLNYIKAVLRKHGKGYSLMAVHTFFTQHSLEIGPLAGQLSSWVEKYYRKLQEAKIVRVGVWGKGEYSSGGYWTLK